MSILVLNLKNSEIKNEKTVHSSLYVAILIHSTANLIINTLFYKSL